MEPMLEGIKVVEAAEWGFVPSAAAILADWGAEVIRIEHPFRGDPMRGLISSMGIDTNGFNFYVEQFNRSKRSVGIDLGNSAGRDILLQLVSDADVFITSFLEPARERLRITYDDLREVNPRLVYARGHGWGQRGAESANAGFDGVSYWARAGVGYLASPKTGPAIRMPGGAFGDVQGGLALAAGIAAALYRRSVTGRGGLIDVSLLGAGVWAVFPDILLSQAIQKDSKSIRSDQAPANPLSGMYATGGGRSVSLAMMQSDRYWPGFCRALGLESLFDHPDYRTSKDRADHAQALFDVITSTFLSRPLDHWVRTLSENECVFAPFLTPFEVLSDSQVNANGYLPDIPDDRGLRLVSSPVQYNNGVVEVRSPAPEAGQHTEEVLSEIGLTQDDILQLKIDGVIA